MSANTNHDANLSDDAFGQDANGNGNTEPTAHNHEPAQTDPTGTETPDYSYYVNRPESMRPLDGSPQNPDSEQEYEDDYDDEQDGAALTEQNPAPDHTERNAKRKQIAIVLGLGLLAILGIGGFLWKMTLSANGFKAPVPSEPIDVAERQSNRKNQPTDYADEEHMQTMNYDDVNSIYGLTLKKQEANRLANKDSAQQNPSVQRELARSQQLSRQPNNRRTSSTGNYGSSGRRSPSGYASTGYGSTYGGRSSAYGDPYGANPTREQVLLQAGFNTVKADGNDKTNYGSQQTLPPPSLASVEVEDNEPIPGVVSGDQTIMNGTRVMFRTLADAKIRDRFAPKGSILIGFAQVGSNRAVFNITTLRLSTGEAVPVRLRALDPDMNEGLALQSDKPARQQVDQATNNALSQAAGQAAWSAGYSVNQATRSAVAGNALASLGAGLASAATTGRRREARQKLSLQDGFKVFFVPIQ